MSVAEILEEVKSYSVEEMEALETSIRLERLRRAKRSAPAVEMRLLQIINQPLPHTERFTFLTSKWQEEGLSDEERAELIDINMERENQNVERVSAVHHLSELRGVDFLTLWRQLMGTSPKLIVPRD